MAAPTKPALIKAFGAESWGFLVAVADKSAPTAIELEAATGFNLSCSVFGEQEGITATTEKVTLPRLLCETTTYESNGPTSYAMADLMVSFDPQSAPASAGKKAWETMVDNANGFLVHRLGKTSTAVFAAGDYVNIIPVQLATKTVVKTSNAPDGVAAFNQAVSITGAPAFNVVVV